MKLIHTINLIKEDFKRNNKNFKSIIVLILFRLSSFFNYRKIIY